MSDRVRSSLVFPITLLGTLISVAGCVFAASYVVWRKSAKGRRMWPVFGLIGFTALTILNAVLALVLFDGRYRGPAVVPDSQAQARATIFAYDLVFLLAMAVCKIFAMLRLNALTIRGAGVNATGWLAAGVPAVLGVTSVTYYAVRFHPSAKPDTAGQQRGNDQNSYVNYWAAYCALDIALELFFLCVVARLTLLAPLRVRRGENGGQFVTAFALRSGGVGIIAVSATRLGLLAAGNDPRIDADAGFLYVLITSTELLVAILAWCLSTLKDVIQSFDAVLPATIVSRPLGFLMTSKRPVGDESKDDEVALQPSSSHRASGGLDFACQDINRGILKQVDFFVRKDRDSVDQSL